MSASKSATSLVITTRGSKLALWQANYVASLLAERGLASEQLVLKTTGDKIQDRFLHEIGGKGLFIKELEQALQSGNADLAVHSLKDMTARLAPEFALAAVLKRHSPADRIIFHPRFAALIAPQETFGADDLRALGKLTVGTGSLRRQAALRRSAPELQCVGIRGNVDTRLRKLHEGEWDAIILAEASLDRLGIKDTTSRRLDPSWFVPCAAQGALAIETLSQAPARALVAPLGDPLTTLHVTIERSLLARLGGDCTMPFGCYAMTAPANGGVAVTAVIYDQDGNEARAHYLGDADAADGGLKAVEALTHELKAQGAGHILARLGLRVPAEFA